MTHDPRPEGVRDRKMKTFGSAASSPSDPHQPPLRLRQASDAPKPGSPVVPVIRTQQASPTEPEVNLRALKRRSASLDSMPKNRNWADFASFMRTQKDKGFSEIRVPKNVHFREQDSPQSGRSSPLLTPARPSDRSRPASPAARPPSSRRYVDEDAWSPRMRPSPRAFSPDPERNPSPRSAGLLGNSAHDLSSRRRGHDVPSPLGFGARGPNIKPPPRGHHPPPVPIKDEKREKLKGDDRDRRGYGGDRGLIDVHGLGLGIHGNGIRAGRAI
jgi:hypothetical protein